MTILAYLCALICLLLNATLFIRLKPPYNFIILWMPQLFHHAFSPFLVVLGLVGTVLGWLANAPTAVVVGLIGAGISAVYVWAVTRPQPGLEIAFGADWPTKIPAQQAAPLLQRRWRLGLPPTPEPRLEQNIPFWTIPGTDRQLLCDLWQPPEGVPRSGLAIIYYHGGAWYLADKDFATRPFFRQLVAQGHVVLDVAYRMCPEVDIYGMIGDVKRAVAWMKANAPQYGVNPERIVLAGGSAGAHLALLAAYSTDHPRLTPQDLEGCDLTARAVVSYYGPMDLRAVYEHTVQTRTLKLPKVEIGRSGAAATKRNFQDAGRLDMLLGGHLHEIPEIYELASPTAHVHPGCPPTLLIQGELDCITPVSAAHELYRRLVDCGVPAINIIYPLTQHGFDLPFPQVSPPSQAALYEVERFLALMV